MVSSGYSSFLTRMTLIKELKRMIIEADLSGTISMNVK